MRPRGGELEVDLGGATHVARPYAADAFVVEALEQPLRFLERDGQVWALATSLRVHRKVS